MVSVEVSGTAVARQQVPEEFKFFFGPNMPSQQESVRPFRGQGSGVIIDAQKGYILTNNHVIQNADKIQIQLNDGRKYDATLIGRDPQTDIALLQVKNAPNLTAITRRIPINCASVISPLLSGTRLVWVRPRPRDYISIRPQRSECGRAGKLYPDRCLHQPG